VCSEIGLESRLQAVQRGSRLKAGVQTQAAQVQVGISKKTPSQKGRFRRSPDISQNGDFWAKNEGKDPLQKEFFSLRNIL